MIRAVIFAFLFAAAVLTGRTAATETSCGYLVRGMYWVCKVRGAGEPVLFIHGALSNGAAWDGQIDDLAKSHYLAIPDLRHHGTAAVKTPEPYSHALHVEDLVDLVQRGGTSELRTRPLRLVGQGFGAEIALLLALRLPDRMRSLVLDEPDFPSLVAELPDGQALLAERNQQLTWVRGLAYGGAVQRAAGAYFRWLSGGDASRQIMGANADDFGFIPEARRKTFLGLGHTLPAHLTMPLPALTCAQLGGFKAPVLVTVGEKTSNYFKRAAEALARCIPGARIATIPEAGHGAPFDYPAAFNRELLEFFAKN